MAGGPTGPVAGPSNLDDLVAKLEDRTFVTYKARLYASQRLHRRSSAWNACLIAFSTSTLIAAVGMISKGDMYGDQGDTLMIALSLLSLIASLIVASMNYGGRSRALEANYKRIQQISLRAELLRVDAGKINSAQYDELLKEYSIALESSENHTDGDYALAVKDPSTGQSKGDHKAINLDRIMTVIPYLSTIFPILILIPFTKWLLNGS